MDRLKMRSPNLTEENIGKIRNLFPGCVTESADESGKIWLAVDFDQLRQELSENIVEGDRERYRLDWPGKRDALVAANSPIAKTLRPVPSESVNFDTTDNIFIEGDNLEALKLLQDTCRSWRSTTRRTGSTLPRSTLRRPTTVISRSTRRRTA